MATEQWTLRVDPRLDKDVRKSAQREGLSLTAYVISVLRQHEDSVRAAS